MATVWERMLKAVGLRKDTRDDVIPPGWVLRDVGGYTVGGHQTIPPAPQDFLDEYRRSLFVYACVSAKASACANAPVVLKRYRKGTDEVITEHPILDLLGNPAPRRTWQNMVEFTIAHQDLVGAAFWEKGRTRDKDESGMEFDGPVKRLWLMFPDRVETVAKPREGVVAYKYRPNFGIAPIVFKPEEVAAFLLMDPGREFVGCGAMGPGFMSSRMDTAATKWNASFFNNGAQPDIVLSTDKPMPPEERKRIKTEYTEPQKGPAKGRGVYFAPYGVKVDSFASTHREMQFDRLKRSVRDEVMGAFRVPPILLGLDTSSYASATTQLVMFRDYVMVPRMRSIFATLKSSIINEFEGGDDLYLDLDLSEMKMPEERDRDYNRALTWFQAGLLDENEARAMANIPPLTPEQVKAREAKAKEAQAAQMAQAAAQQQAEAPAQKPQPKTKEQVSKPDGKDVQPRAQETDVEEPEDGVAEPADAAVPKRKPGKNGKNGKAGLNGAARKSDERGELLRKRTRGIPWDDILGAED